MKIDIISRAIETTVFVDCRSGQIVVPESAFILKISVNLGHIVKLFVLDRVYGKMPQKHPITGALSRGCYNGRFSMAFRNKSQMRSLFRNQLIKCH